MPNNNHQFSEEAPREKNETHEVLEKGDDVGVDKVHSSRDFEVFVVDAVGHSSGFCHWSLSEILYLSFEGYRNSQVQSVFGGGDVVPG